MRKHPAVAILICSFAMALALNVCAGAQEKKPKTPPAPGPMLDQGTMDLDTPDFTLSLVRSSQTIAALKPKSVRGFDFTPGDLLVERSQNGYFHLGDIDLRLRTGTSAGWQNYSTSTARAPVWALPPSKDALAAADLTPTLPTGFPLQIIRIWALEQGRLVLRFSLKNKSSESVQVGALASP
jgi:hypothetical protein